MREFNEQSILTFCHQIKAAGTTFTDILRSNYGLSHLNVEPLSGHEHYRRENLDRDLRWMPWLRSLAGHSIRPHLDYGPHTERMRWITWLRDPVSRLISGYQHGVEKNGLKTGFAEWLQQPGHRNLQVYFLTGDSDDLESAKRILNEKFIFIGFVEYFDEDLSRLKNVVGDSLFYTSYSNVSNPAVTGQVAVDIRQNYKEYKELIDENTRVDQALYDWALARFRSSSRTSPEPHLANNLKTGESGNDMYNASMYRRKCNLYSNYLFRHIVYKPILSKIG